MTKNNIQKTKVRNIVKDETNRNEEEVEIRTVEKKAVQYKIKYMDDELTSIISFKNCRCTGYQVFNPTSGWGISYTQGWSQQNKRDQVITMLINYLYKEISSLEETSDGFLNDIKETDVDKVFEFKLDTDNLIFSDINMDDYDNTYKIQIDGVEIETEDVEIEE